MLQSFYHLCSKLLLLVAMSTGVFVIPQARVAAHEVVPTIADLTVEAGQSVTFEMRINLEAFLAGIDMDAVGDTDEDDAANAYSALRALFPDALAERVPGLVRAWNATPLAETGAAVAFEVANIDVPEGIDMELPRISVLTLSANLPDDTGQITINWPAGSGPLVVRQQGVEEPYTGYLNGGDSSPPIAFGGGGAQSGMQAFLSYIPVGFDHILPKGLDHILFVLGLFFLSTRLRPLVLQVSTFTLAHTVTLALGALGLVSVPGSIVEPLIAASIVYVAVENVFTSGLSRWRPVVIFCFGLLHGLGFASVLGEFGLPDDQFIPALIGFNVGVEVGQLTVIALAFAVVGWFSGRDWYRKIIAVPASCMIAAVGAFWVVERVFL